MEEVRNIMDGYFVYHQTTNDVKGPFYPKNKAERLAEFVKQTSDGDPQWRGCFWNKLPAGIRLVFSQQVSCYGCGADYQARWKPDDLVPNAAGGGLVCPDCYEELGCTEAERA